MPASRRRRLISLGRPAVVSPSHADPRRRRANCLRSLRRSPRTVPLGAAVVRGELHVEVDGAALSGVAALRFELPREDQTATLIGCETAVSEESGIEFHARRERGAVERREGSDAIGSP